MGYSLSRAVGEGTVVTKHGNKLIRCGRGREAMGVWTNGRQNTIITLEGERIISDVPAGVVTWGPASVVLKQTEPGKEIK